MSNMSYCRFQNTASDLQDCVNNLCSLNPEDNGYNAEEERYARARIIRMAARMLAELNIDDPADEHEVEQVIEQLDAGYNYDESDEDC